MPEPARLLIAHENAESWQPLLNQRFPGLRVRVVQNAEELDASADFPATIAYSCVTDGFPRHHHGRLRDRPGLEWVHVGGSGFDHFLPLPSRLPLPSKGFTLTNGAGVLAPFLAETLIGAILALNRGFIKAIHEQRAGDWRPRCFAALETQTLAIVGTGAIGTALAERAKHLGLTVIGLARQPKAKMPFDLIEPLDALAEVAARSDYLSLNVRLTPETRHLVDARVLVAMRPGSFLLNAARGAVVDEAALIEALAERRIGGAYLDVFEREPLAPESPLRQLDNVLITPHMSDRVADWELRHARFFMDNLTRWLEGRLLENVVIG